MTTKVAGGVISSRLAITLECTYAAAIGDVVMGGPGDYQCQQYDGTKPILGDVVTPNVRRGSGALAGTYPQPNVPGDVSVGVRAHAVQTKTSGAAITVGSLVNIGADQKVYPSGTATTQPYGTALMGAAGSGIKIDVLVQ